MEACGTSGMKAALNGVLNASILDGWWCEGIQSGAGVAYRQRGRVRGSQLSGCGGKPGALQYYRKRDRTPLLRSHGRGGAQGVVKNDEGLHEDGHVPILQPADDFEYEERFYLPASRRFQELVADGGAEASELSEQHRRYLEKWDQIQVAHPASQREGPFRVNQSFEVTTVVQTGNFNRMSLTWNCITARCAIWTASMRPQVKMMTVKEEQADRAPTSTAVELPCAIPAGTGLRSV
jgi:starch phosphorylase